MPAPTERLLKMKSLHSLVQYSWIGIVALVLSGCADQLGSKSSQDASTASTPPNIIFILADDLGWDDVGFHGGPIATPHIDSLAADGIELDRLYSMPFCSPTRTALMTGKHPVRLGMATTLCNEYVFWASLNRIHHCGCIS